MRTNRIRAAAAFAWLGLALASNTRAGDLRDWSRKYETASERFLVLDSFYNEAVLGTSATAADGPAALAGLRLDGERLSLRADRMPLTRLVASLNRSGHVAVVVRGGAAQITVSDSFEATDIGQALRRLLSTSSHVLIDRRTAADATRVLEVILLLSPAAPGSEPMAEAIPPVETDEGPAAAALPDAPEQPLDVPPTEELLAQQLSGPYEQLRARAAAPRARGPGARGSPAGARAERALGLGSLRR